MKLCLPCTLSSSVGNRATHRELRRAGPTYGRGAGEESHVTRVTVESIVSKCRRNRRLCETLMNHHRVVVRLSGASAERRDA